MKSVIIAINVILLSASAFAVPVVTIDQVPAWQPGNYSGYLSGRLSGVPDPTQYLIAPLIYLPGGGWTSKPYAPAQGYYDYVHVNPNGTWSALVTTGGYDTIATDYLANLYTTPGSVPFVAGAGTPPISSLASSYTCRPSGRQITWCGLQWQVRTSSNGNSSGAFGPGSNYFTDSPNYVSVDGAGHPAHEPAPEHDRGRASDRVAQRGQQVLRRRD